jgi:two-component system sensor histidine kinase/response regulator
MRLLKRMFGGVRGRILAVILFVSVLSSISVGLAAYYIARSSIKTQVTDSLRTTMQSIQEVLNDVWLANLSQQVEFVAYGAGEFEPEVAGSREIADLLSDALTQMPGFKRVSVFINNGTLLGSSDPDYDPGLVRELSNMEAGEMVIIPFRVVGEAPHQEKVMTIAAPLVIGGLVFGSVAGDAETGPLNEELASKRVGKSGEIYLVNGEGQLITLPPLAGEDSGLEILGEPLVTEGVRRVIGGETGVAEYSNYAGEKVLGSYTWIPEAGWGLIVENDAAEAFATLGTLRLSVILIILGMILVAYLAAILFSRRISEPLVELQTGAERLERGDLGYRIDIKTGDELESLGKSFNLMAAAIQTSHEIMEEEVIERTAELRAINEMITSLQGTLSPDEIMQRALHNLMAFTAYEMGWCYLTGEKGWRLLYRRCPPEQEESLPDFIPLGEGTLGQVMERREAVFVTPHDEGDEKMMYSALPARFFTALPMQSTKRVLGLICLASVEDKPISGDVKKTVQAMADEVGVVLENAMLYIELQNHVEELERANRELRTLDEMKSNFISAVTHELKQPLALISGYAQTVYDYYDSLTYEEEMQCMRVVLERAQFLAGLVEDLLDISMLEMGRIRLHREELDLVALARKAAEEYAAAGEGQSITVDFPPSFPLVVADARRMEQVLSNLLSNAVKFSNSEGKIIVSGLVKEDRVEIKVEDQGVGIDPSQLERIFERFYQADASTRRPYPGVGLGLFICRELVEAHGGRIWAENRPEGGSAFVFEIPIGA